MVNEVGSVTVRTGAAGSLRRWLLDAPPGLLVDHINGDKLDNRRSNLRLVTRSQNQANRRPNRTGRSRYKG